MRVCAEPVFCLSEKIFFKERRGGIQVRVGFKPTVRRSPRLLQRFSQNLRGAAQTPRTGELREPDVQ